MRRLLGIVLAVAVLCPSIFLFPVSSEEQDSATTENSVIEYRNFFLGVGDEYLFELQFDVDYYYITTVNSSIVSVIIRDGDYYIKGCSAGKTSILVNYTVNGIFNSQGCVVEVMDNYQINTDTFGTELHYIYALEKNALLCHDTYQTLTYA